VGIPKARSHPGERPCREAAARVSRAAASIPTWHPNECTRAEATIKNFLDLPIPEAYRDIVRALLLLNTSLTDCVDLTLANEFDIMGDSHCRADSFLPPLQPKEK